MENESSYGLPTTKTCTVYGLCRSDAPDVICYVGQTRLAPKVRRSQHVTRARRGEPTALSAWILRAILDGVRINCLVLEENAVWNQSERGWIARLLASGAPLLNAKDGGDGEFRDYTLYPKRQYFNGDIPTADAIELGDRYQAGETRDALATAFECNPDTVMRVVSRLGIKRREGGIPKKPVTVNGRKYKTVVAAMKGEKVGYKELMRMVNGEPKPPKVAKQITAEHAQKISEAAKKRWADPEFKDRAVASIRTVTQTPEWRQQRRDAALKQMADPEMRERIAAKNRDRLSDPAEREKIAERTRQQWADPVERETILAGLRSQRPRKNKR